MQDRWAALLGNAARHDGSERVSPSFPEVLKQLSPTDARILLWFDKNLPSSDPIKHADGILEYGIYASIERDMLDLTRKEIGKALDNLQHHTLVGPGDEDVTWLVSSFGRSFVRACQPPVPTGQPPQPEE